MKIEKEELDIILNQARQIDAISKQIAALEAQKNKLVNSYSIILEDSNNTRKELEEKYGSISIDLSDGSYTITENES
tara:strand:- start:15230 stop:15460 length:231 start_codon:yes stop_codon:yes gene_type:complete